MITVGTKDKLVLAILLPLGLAVAYWYLWRAPFRARVAALEREHLNLVDPDQFPLEKTALQNRLKTAEAKRTAERAIRPADPSFVGNPDTELAERQDAVFSVLRTHGIRILHAERKEAESPLRHTLERTGCRPCPDCLSLTLEAAYPALVAALTELERQKAAVIPASIRLQSGTSTCRWELIIWL
ncbi:MAG: hypothetical protein IJR99_06845 [Kiritimatiellae bacterium]|nr:hypothetical protein [Kiritimatiellia bacterium]